MKKRIAFIFAVALMIGAVLSSCQKYEEDYGLQMKSPKGRLVGKWKVAQIDVDTMSIKMSDYSMFGTLFVTFEKDETGTIAFSDNGLGDILEGIDWEEILAEMGDNVDIDNTDLSEDDMSLDPDDIDFVSLLKQETKFKWAFNDDKTYLELSAYDETTSSYIEAIDMKILSLCKSDCKFRYEEDSTRVDVSMQK